METALAPETFREALLHGTPALGVTAPLRVALPVRAACEALPAWEVAVSVAGVVAAECEAAVVEGNTKKCLRKSN